LPLGYPALLPFCIPPGMVAKKTYQLAASGLNTCKKEIEVTAKALAQGTC
jgi:hypothetical protein